MSEKPDRQFHVMLGPELRADLRRRLDATRWSDAVTADWRYGMDKAFLQTLIRHRHDYDFDAAEARLSRLPQFLATVGGFVVHYVHLKGNGPRATPLLLMNGWPSSFVEYRKLAPMLADPAAYGGNRDDAFDVVMPTLPGFGFSDRPTRPGHVWAENLFHDLMTGHLGFASYVAAGTDIGSGVATRLGLKHSKAVRGIHISAVADPPLTAVLPPLDASETAYRASVAKWDAERGAYEHVHYTKPQTLAFALADSSVGLASWIVEKFYSWSDRGPDLFETFPAEMLLDNLHGLLGDGNDRLVDARVLRSRPLSSWANAGRPRACADGGLHLAKRSRRPAESMGRAPVRCSALYRAASWRTLSRLGSARCLCTRFARVRKIATCGMAVSPMTQAKGDRPWARLC